jgi:hypothetical protein
MTMQGSAVPTNTNVITGDGQIMKSGQVGRGKLHSVILTAGVDAATVTVYDHASSATGNVLAYIATPAGTTAQIFVGRTAFVNGLYADTTGTTPKVQGVYE